MPEPERPAINWICCDVERCVYSPSDAIPARINFELNGVWHDIAIPNDIEQRMEGGGGSLLIHPDRLEWITAKAVE